MPTMEHLLPPAGILRPDHPFLTAWHLARERGLCGKQSPLPGDYVWPAQMMHGRADKPRPPNANAKLCHLPQHCQKQRLLRRWVRSLTPIVTATS